MMRRTPRDPPARRGLGGHLGRDDACDLASVGGQVTLAHAREPVVGDQHPGHVPGVLSLVEREEIRSPRGEPLADGRPPAVHVRRFPFPGEHVPDADEVLPVIAGRKGGVPAAGEVPEQSDSQQQGQERENALCLVLSYREP
jgi:hypothetical protein